jgi:hypothetical protein
MIKVAVPENRLRVPKAVVPLKKVTVPVGTRPGPEELVTVAVKVDDSPKAEGLVLVEAGLTTDVLVLAFWTLCDRADGEELPEKFAVPVYLATIDAVPTGSVVRVKVAVPENRLRVPRPVVPLKKVTVPVGTTPVPEALATVAVKVSDWS